MKKNEAILLAPKKVDVIIEYILQILTSEENISAMMFFSNAKINGQSMCTINIYVPYNNFERHINLGITNDHLNIIYKFFLDKIAEDFIPHESISVSKFYQRSSMSDIFVGIDIKHINGSKIKIKMSGIKNDIVDEYNAKCQNYIEEHGKYNIK